MRKRFWAAMALTVLVPVVGWCLRPGPKPDPRVLPDSAVDESQTYSNILPEDYVGPDACAQCHRQKHALWSQHAHSTMNQLPSQKSVRGDFSGAVLRLPTGAVVFS